MGSVFVAAAGSALGAGAEGAAGVVGLANPPALGNPAEGAGFALGSGALNAELIGSVFVGAAGSAFGTATGTIGLSDSNFGATGGMIDLAGSDLASGALGASGFAPACGMMDFGFSGAGASAFVNFVGVLPNLKVVSLLSLGSSSSEVSFSSGSFRVDIGLIDLFSSSFSASAALAATFAAAA